MLTIPKLTTPFQMERGTRAPSFPASAPAPVAPPPPPAGSRSGGPWESRDTTLWRTGQRDHRPAADVVTGLRAGRRTLVLWGDALLGRHVRSRSDEDGEAQLAVGAPPAVPPVA